MTDFLDKYRNKANYIPRRGIQQIINSKADK